MSKSPTPGLTRKAAKDLDTCLTITLQLQAQGRVTRNDPGKNEMRILVLSPFTLEHVFSRTVGDGDDRRLSEEVGKVAIRGEGKEIWIATGEHERVPYQGLTKQEQQKLGKLSTRDHSALLAKRSAEEQQAVVRELLDSLPPEQKQLMLKELGKAEQREPAAD